MSAKKKYGGTEPSYRFLFVVLLTAVVFSSLFAVRLCIDELGEESRKLFSNRDGLYADWFLCCKERILAVTAVMCVCYFAGEKIFPDKPCGNDPILKRPARLPLILLGVYLTGALISAVFSDNREVVFWGVCAEYEGLAAILSYCVLFMAGYNYFGTGGARTVLRKGLSVLIAVTSVLAAFEYIVMPLMELPFMKYLIAPADYRQAAESLKFSDDFRESVLMFFNSNYMGGFCTLVFPISVYRSVSAKSPGGEIAGGLLTAGCFASVIMSNSTAAFYVVLAESVFMIIFIAVRRIGSLRRLIFVLVSMMVVFAIVSIGTGNEFASNIVKSITNSGGYSESGRVFVIDRLSIEGNDIVFSGCGSEYRITAPVERGEKLEISGEGGTEFTMNASDLNTILVHDKKSGLDFSVLLKDGLIYLDFGYTSTVDFAVTTDGVKLIVQNTELIDSIPFSRFNDTPLSRFYGTATGRGYTWINSLPILGDCLIIGKGAGNFPFAFEQNELAGLLNTHGSYRLIIDKPHSWYLQIALTCGIPALTAVLILFGYFAVSGMRVLVGTKIFDDSGLFLLFIYTGLCGFMIMGLVNDSCVTVNPLFWFLFGTAYLSIRDMKKEEVL